MIESKLKAKNCNRGQLVGSGQHGVAAKNGATSLRANCPLNETQPGRNSCLWLQFLAFSLDSIMPLFR